MYLSIAYLSRLPSSIKKWFLLPLYGQLFPCRWWAAEAAVATSGRSLYSIDGIVMTKRVIQDKTEGQTINPRRAHRMEGPKGTVSFSRGHYKYYTEYYIIVWPSCRRGVNSIFAKFPDNRCKYQSQFSYQTAPRVFNLAVTVEQGNYIDI